MSSQVDDQIVEMKFLNSDFQKGVNQTVKTIGTLKKSLGTLNGKNALDSLQKSASRFTLSKITDGVANLGAKFKTLQVVGITAIATITNKAVDAGLRLVKSFTLDPVIDGFKSYQDQIDATQVILANTAQDGVKLKDVTKSLAVLQKYAQQTVYSFTDMTENIGTFTAAGVDLKTSVGAIKGLANAAALSGASSSQAANVMYQMSQALSAGVVRAQDWISVVNGGMASYSFQKALYETGKAMGTITNQPVGQSFDQWTKAAGGFKGSLQSGWLTAKVMTQTLKTFTGEYTAKQIQAMGYTKAQAKELAALGKRASDAATHIKTWGQLTDALKEEVTGAWAQIFKTLFGNLNQATAVFTALHNVLEPLFTGPILALNTILKQWSELGGRSAVIQGIVNIWTALSDVFKAIGKAWDEAFPNSGQGIAKVLADISKGFEKFTEHLIPSKTALADITDIFKTVFQVLGVGASVIGGVIKYFAAFLGLFINSGATGGAADGILGIIAAVARLISSFLEMTDLKDRISSFFNAIIEARKEALEPIIKTVGGIIAALGPLFHGNISGFVNGISKAIGNLGGLGDYISGLGDKIGKLASKFSGAGGLIGVLGKGLKVVSDILHNAGDAVKNFFQQFSDGSTKIDTGFFGKFKDVLAAIGGYIVDLSKKVGEFLGIIGGGAGKAGVKTLDGLKSGAKGAADAGSALGDAWSGFVNALQWVWDKIKLVASAIGAGIGKIHGYLGGLLGDFSQLSMLQIVQLVFSGATFIYIKKFIDSFAGAFDTFKEIGESVQMPFKQLTSNLETMQQGVKAKIILEIASAVGILAGSIFLLSKIPAAKIGVSLGAIAGIMGVLMGSMIGLMKVTKKSGTAQLIGVASSLVIVASALTAMAGAVALFGKMDFKTLKTGFISIGIGLGLLTAALAGLGMIGPEVLAGAASIAILSTSLGIMATGLVALTGAILLYSKIKWKTLASGMGKIAVTLVALGVAGAAFGEIGPGLLVGAAAIGVFSVTLTAMLGTILLFNKVSWGTLGSGLGKIALALVAIGTAAAVVSPGLIALGIASALLGAGLLAAGTGMALFGVGLTAVAAAGTAAFAVLIAGIQAFLAVLPAMGVELVEALVTILKVLAKESPAIVKALVKIGNELAKGFVELQPAIQKIINTLIDILLDTIVHWYPKLVTAGIQLFEALLKGLGDNAGELMDQMGKTILQLLQALDAAINKYETPIIHEGIKIADDIIKGLVQGLVPAPIRKGISKIVSAMVNFFKKLLGIHSPSTVFQGFGLNIIQGLLKGLASLGAKLKSVFTKAFSGAWNAVSSGIKKIVNGVAELPGKIAGLAGRVISAAAKLGRGIINGIGQGLKAAGGWAAGIGNAIEKAINDALNLPRSIGGWKISKGPFHVTFPTITIPALAKGTDYFGGGTALVGEKGPELVSMGRGASVLTNKNLADFVKVMKKLVDELKRTQVTSSKSAVISPVIRPVIDMSEIKKNASKVNSLMSASTSYSQAASISNKTQTRALADAVKTNVKSGDTTFEYVQNNYSPKALPSIEIYRNTKSQLAQVKEALDKS